MEGVLNVPNRTLYHGDNLDFMRALDSNSIDLIATDPALQQRTGFPCHAGLARGRRNMYRNPVFFELRNVKRIMDW